ncbi:phage antirepressor KilAC domain-containing protein [Thermoclostridium stercorarium]|jgi:anti-repressor protein|uniref:phage antirepressor KilAC domain-containing protein n=1 Tax=Thermoclostridium stercorarium TaxID=1510 RepID=UPI002248B062|nr:phage antirepressor KilAC domain-containing protein [Thermoclostridium stercorarium]UZQ86007.1 phage antirepressor KilAC domain-containing protein [Thermoclostridium stercorarium]
MNDLTLVKSANFGNVKCDFWMDSNGDIWLTRKQIGQALRYADPQKAIDNLHAKHADRLNKFSVTLKVRGTDGKFYDTTLYNAKGIMEICRWSQQPKADSFMDWVWEVIDSIRKHGGYLTPQKVEEILLNPDTIIQLATALKEERQKRLELEPKAEQFDKFISGENYQDMNTTAKVLGWGRNKLFAELRQRKILMSDNRPYQRYIDAGYFVVKEKPIQMGGQVFNKPQTYVTAKGVSWLEKLLSKEGALV